MKIEGEEIGWLDARIGNLCRFSLEIVVTVATWYRAVKSWERLVFRCHDCFDVRNRGLKQDCAAFLENET